MKSNHPEYKHEPKACPRCTTVFECKVGSVGNCQCQAVKLSDDDHKRIQLTYNDCLCADCLKAVKREYFAKRFQEKVKQLFRYRN